MPPARFLVGSLELRRAPLLAALLAALALASAALATFFPDSPAGALLTTAGGIVFGQRLSEGAPALRIAAAACPRNFDVASGFGPEGPRLWLWWTEAEAAGSGAGAAHPTGTGWMMPECLASVRRHTALPLRGVSIVNSSATRGAGAPFRLRRFPLPSYFDDLPVNHQGDFGSFALLAEFGGVYLDSDMLVLHPLEPIVRLLERFEFVGFGGHTGDRGVHHGLMAARPRSEVLARAYHAALTVYAELGGCAGATCAHRERISWLTTLEAFSREAAAMQRDSLAAAGGDATSGEAVSASCRYARMPTRHFEPGLSEHDGMCHAAYEAVFLNANIGTSGGGTSGGAAAVAPPAKEAQYVSAVLQSALVGTMRVLHLSPSKHQYPARFPGWRSEPRLAHCPLLLFLLNISEGRTDLELAQRIGAENIDVFEQREADFWPGR